jgi:hypothetical protein
MKSSTLRRSNLSKERMIVLEELSKNRKKPYDTSPGVYIPVNKEKELDVLWQNFKINQKEEKSPGVFLVTGFITGAVAMLIITTLLSFTVQGNNSQDFDSTAKSKEKARLTFIPADKSITEETNNISKELESYTVKSGDTLENIIIRFYGKNDPSKVAKIKSANKMSNVNKLKIGQVLFIPMT